MEILNASVALRSKVDAYLQQGEKDKPVVVAWGLMNAGKSYLLNMLTQHFETEFFKTNDFRETASISEFEMSDRIYLDTPGLDANYQDNLVALKGIKQADVVLFVHQLQGELEAVEIDFLKDVRESFGEYAQDNIILVLSKVDKEEPEKVNQIQEKVLEQCQNNLGFIPKCFQISNVYYQEGMQSHTDELIEYSHVQDLQETLSHVLAGSVAKVRQERANNERMQLLQLCLDMQSKLEEEWKVRAYSFGNAFESFASVMSNFEDFIEEKSQKYQNI